MDLKEKKTSFILLGLSFGLSIFLVGFGLNPNKYYDVDIFRLVYYGITDARIISSTFVIWIYTICIVAITDK